MDRPLVSIITPTHNHGRFIDACIESIKGQTYENWEMVVVDDGSSDDTWEIVRRYACGDSRIRPFRQANKGIWRLSETYNFALGAARGELIAIIEGDDRWPASKLETQVPLHIAGEYALSFGLYQYIDVSGALISEDVYPDARLPFLKEPDRRDLFIRYLRSEYTILPVTVLLTRSWLQHVGGFRQPPYLPLVDYPTWLMLGETPAGYGYIPAILGYWRQSSSQATWVLARDIAYGIYRCACEFALERRKELGLEHCERLEQFLLSDSRRGYLADSNYRAAAVAFDRGEIWKAMRYWAELGRMGEYRLLSRCMAMFAVKMGRRLVTGRAAAHRALVRGAEREGQ